MGSFPHLVDGRQPIKMTEQPGRVSPVSRSFFTWRQTQVLKMGRGPVPPHRCFSASAGFPAARASHVTKPRLRGGGRSESRQDGVSSGRGESWPLGHPPPGDKSHQAAFCLHTVLQRTSRMSLPYLTYNRWPINTVFMV